MSDLFVCWMLGGLLGVALSGLVCTLITLLEGRSSMNIKCPGCPINPKGDPKRILKGRGSIPADILVLGSGPSYVDGLLRKVNAGEEGKFFNYMLERSGLASRRIYYSNIVLCAPRILKGMKYVGRDPERDEILACMSHVNLILHEVNPEVVILLGDLAKQYYTRKLMNAYSITHPDFIWKTGGTSSPYFLKAMNQLEEIDGCFED